MAGPRLSISADASERCLDPPSPGPYCTEFFSIQNRIRSGSLEPPLTGMPPPGRNPRRAYTSHGTAIPPMTLGNMRAQGIRDVAPMQPSQSCYWRRAATLDARTLNHLGHCRLLVAHHRAHRDRGGDLVLHARTQSGVRATYSPSDRPNRAGFLRSAFNHLFTDAAQVARGLAMPDHSPTLPDQKPPAGSFLLWRLSPVYPSTPRGGEIPLRRWLRDAR